MVNKGAKIIINKEFKIANHVIGTSVSEDWNSLYNLKITIAQIIKKLKAKVIFENKILLAVVFIRLYKTYVIINKELWLQVDQQF